VLDRAAHRPYQLVAQVPRLLGVGGGYYGLCGQPFSCIASMLLVAQVFQHMQLAARAISRPQTDLA
jgi:hypothetical protein